MEIYFRNTKTDKRYQRCKAVGRDVKVSDKSWGQLKEINR